MSQQKVLVVGGCGFVGYHIVQALKKEGIYQSISVISRNPTKNLVDGVTYKACDLISKNQIVETLMEIKPSTIIHSASPQAENNNHSEQYFLESNFGGTQNLLQAAAEVGCVRAFVYTSSVSIHSSTSFRNLTEDAPVYEKSTRTQNYYAKSKALSDTYVLLSNGLGGIQTCCLRVTGIYGERDAQLTPSTLAILHAGNAKVRIGDSSVKQDYTSVENVAKAHVLAVKALNRSNVTNEHKVAGEAFFISDGEPVAYFDLARKMWAAAGDKTPKEEIKTVPAGLMINVASIIEWLFWIFTFNLRRPQKYRRHVFEYICSERTLCLDKAQTRLGYVPDNNRDGSIDRAVKRILKQTSKEILRKDM